MISVNEARILGVLGKDAECHYTANGTAWCSFDVATTKSIKQQDGSWKNTTEWHRVETWRKQAEYCGKNLKKRSRVYVEGEMTKRTGEKDGRKQSYAQIVAHKIIALDQKSGVDGERIQSAEALHDHDSGGFDQDIPF